MSRFRLPLFIADQPWWLGGSPLAVLLTLGSLVALGMAVWAWRGGPAAVPRQELAAYNNPRRYPNTPFTTQQQDRKVVYSTTSGPIGTAVFTAVDVAQKPTAGAPTAAALAASIAGTTFSQQLAAKGYTASVESFISAARQGDLPILLAFIKNGFDVHQTNAFGNTGLHAAAEANQPNAVKFLIAAGSSIDAANGRGQTPLHRAADANLPGMAQLLLAAGANADAPNADGQTPLFYAVNNNNADIAHALLAGGAKATVADRYKSTALHAAVRKGLADMARLLIAAGAQVDAPDINGTTPLHLAIQAGNYQLAKLLLDNGANAALPARDGTTPMNMALDKQNMAIANLLLAHGATRPNALGK